LLRIAALRWAARRCLCTVALVTIPLAVRIIIVEILFLFEKPHATTADVQGLEAGCALREGVGRSDLAKARAARLAGHYRDLGRLH
jgi:hypothetical protein